MKLNLRLSLKHASTLGYAGAAMMLVLAAITLSKVEIRSQAGDYGRNGNA